MEKKQMDIKSMSTNDIIYGSFRKIVLTGEVDSFEAKDIINTINVINHYDDKKEKKMNGAHYERKPIELIINSIGGSIYDGFAITAAMDASVTPVNTLIYGQAMSMGFIIALHGKQRTMHKQATIMYHELSSAIAEKLEEQKRNIKESVRIQKMLDAVVLKRTNLKKSKLDEIKKITADFYISADQAKEFGIVDKVFG